MALYMKNAAKMMTKMIPGISCRVGQRIADPLAGMMLSTNRTRRDAVLFSFGANSAHGLQRTNDDKRRAVTTLLTDADWAKWADREIARRCGVDHRFVASVKTSLGTVPSEPRTYTTKHGTVSTMNTGNIGKAPAVLPSSEPAPFVVLQIMNGARKWR
jgi:hypothetical protein